MRLPALEPAQLSVLLLLPLSLPILLRIALLHHRFPQVKAAKEKAYKKTRNSLRVSGADGLDDDGLDLDDEVRPLSGREGTRRTRSWESLRRCRGREGGGGGRGDGRGGGGGGVDLRRGGGGYRRKGRAQGEQELERGEGRVGERQRISETEFGVGFRASCSYCWPLRSLSETSPRMRAWRSNLLPSPPLLPWQDAALVPKQELHDIDDYRRDVAPGKQLWGGSAASGAGRGAEPPRQVRPLAPSWAASSYPSSSPVIPLSSLLPLLSLPLPHLSPLRPLLPSPRPHQQTLGILMLRRKRTRSRSRAAEGAAEGAATEVAGGAALTLPLSSSSAHSPL